MFDEKAEWHNFILQSSISKKDEINLLKKLKAEEIELSDEFKDNVVNIIELSKKAQIQKKKDIKAIIELEDKKIYISAKEKYAINPIKWIKDKWPNFRNKKKEKNEIQSPKIVTPKITQPKVRVQRTPTVHLQDSSLEELLVLKNAGYDTVIWHISDAHVLPDVCEELNNKEFNLEQFINETTHSASLFSHSHVNCKCFLEVYSQANPELPHVNVGSGNRYASISKKDELRKKSSIIDYPYASLPEDLWDKVGSEFVLKESIRHEIIEAVETVLESEFEHYKEWYLGLELISSLATNFWISSSDIDIKIISDLQKLKEVEPLKDIEYENNDEFLWALLKKVRQYDYKIGTHPLDLFLVSLDEINKKNYEDRTDSIFNVLENTWRKKPHLIEMDKFNREEIIQRAKDEALRWCKEWDLDIGEIKRAIRNYELITEHLKLLNLEEKLKFKDEIQKVLVDIDNTIEHMVVERTEVKTERSQGYEAQFTPDIDKYLISLNWMPSNVQYKLLEKWGYEKLIKDLSDIKDDSPITEEEIPEIKEVIKNSFLSKKDELRKQGLRGFEPGTIREWADGHQHKKLENGMWIQLNEKGEEIKGTETRKDETRENKNVKPVQLQPNQSPEEKLNIASWVIEQGREVSFEKIKGRLKEVVKKNGQVVYRIETAEGIKEVPRIKVEKLKDDKQIQKKIVEATPEKRIQIQNEIFGGETKTVEQVAKEIEAHIKSVEYPVTTKKIKYDWMDKEVDVVDYTGIKPIDIKLIPKDKIETMDKPDYIPVVSLDQFKYARMSFNMAKLSDNNYLIVLPYKDEKTKFVTDKYCQLSGENLVATIDYYKNKINIEFDKKVQSTYDELLRRNPDIKGDKEKEKKLMQTARKHHSKGKSMGANKMTYTQMRLIEKVYKTKSRKETWEKYREMMLDLGYKSKDVEMEFNEDNDTFAKGEETSYGDTGLKDDLLKDMGVRVKRQDGSEIKPEQINQIKVALSNVYKIFGDRTSMCRNFGLKISHAGQVAMHARKAVGLYFPHFKAIGVSAGQGEFGFTLSHEFAHFIDNYLGERIQGSHKYSSDDWGSVGGRIATTFRKNMVARPKGAYWNRTCECFARAFEQYFMKKTTNDDYEILDQYCKKEVFDKQIEPLIDEFLKTNDEVLKKSFQLIKRRIILSKKEEINCVVKNQKNARIKR